MYESYVKSNGKKTESGKKKKLFFFVFYMILGFGENLRGARMGGGRGGQAQAGARREEGGWRGG